MHGDHNTIGLTFFLLLPGPVMTIPRATFGLRGHECVILGLGCSGHRGRLRATQISWWGVVTGVLKAAGRKFTLYDSLLFSLVMLIIAYLLSNYLYVSFYCYYFLACLLALLIVFIMVITVCLGIIFTVVRFVMFLLLFIVQLGFQLFLFF